MQAGTVKFYSSDKGFGFIVPDDNGPDLFVHVSTLKGVSELSEGTKVMFDVAKSKGRAMATNVTAA